MTKPNICKNNRILVRTRVNLILSSLLEYPLTVVAAPMGYGKTTAVREFLKFRGIEPVWVSLMASDGTMSFFWNQCSARIEKVSKKLGGQLKSLGYPADAPQTAIILQILREIKLDWETVVVIDDFHLAASPENVKLFSFIAKEEIPHLHIVLITREVADCRFTELASRCFTVTDENLKFNRNEIEQYCKMMQYTPLPKEIDSVADYTDGWITIIYLVLLGLKTGAPIGSSRTIDELVDSNIYSLYNDETKQLLGRLAYLESFSPQQAAFVLEQPDIAAELQLICKKNALIHYDEATDTYKIHNVMLNFLRKQHCPAPEQVRALYRKIGEWNLLQRQYCRAYSCFYKAGEFEYILQLLDNKDNITNEFAQFEGYREMFSALPREVLFQYPMACLQYVFLLLLSGVSEYFSEGMQIVAGLEQAYTEMHALTEEYRRRVLGEIQVIRIFTVFNDAGKMVAFAGRASQLLEGRKSFLLRRDNEFTFGSPELIYSFYKYPGHLRETLEIIVQGFPSFYEMADGCGAGSEYLAPAEFALETGDYAEVELNSLKAVYMAQARQQTSIIICAKFVLIRLYIMQGRIDEALDLFERLKQEVRAENNAIYNTTLDLCQGYISGCLGQLNHIPVWLQKGDMSDANFLYQGMAFNYIVYGKAVLLAHNYIELEMLTECFQSYFSIYDNQLGFIYNYIYRAAAKYMLYGIDQGGEELARAIAIGQADNIIMPFAENAPYIMEMLKSLLLENSYDKYLRRVYKACQQYQHSLASLVQGTPALSQREKEVLQLLSQGLSREEIAAQLFVSPGTIKTHLQNIYKKLEVNGKVRAIRKAEELDII
jgi:LuxR family maltose regulon positive regulatory protein